eukprot:3563643-Alexandrium_andersonii.AAC.1
MRSSRPRRASGSWAIGPGRCCLKTDDEPALIGSKQVVADALAVARGAADLQAALEKPPACGPQPNGPFRTAVSSSKVWFASWCWPSRSETRG